LDDKILSPVARPFSSIVEAREKLDEFVACGSLEETEDEHSVALLQPILHAPAEMTARHSSRFIPQTEQLTETFNGL
jgi:hypothetical protein